MYKGLLILIQILGLSISQHSVKVIQTYKGIQYPSVNTFATLGEAFEYAVDRDTSFSNLYTKLDVKYDKITCYNNSGYSLFSSIIPPNYRPVAKIDIYYV